MFMKCERECFIMHELLSTEERIKVLQYALECRIVGVEEVAKVTRLSRELVSKTLSLLAKYGIAEKERRKLRIPEIPQKRELKRFLNFITLYPKLRALKEDWVVSLGLYGELREGGEPAGERPRCLGSHQKPQNLEVSQAQEGDRACRGKRGKPAPVHPEAPEDPERKRPGVLLLSGLRLNGDTGGVP